MSRPRSPLALAGGLLFRLALLASAAAAAAQAPPAEPPAARFGERLDVVLVEVEAVVFDRRGHRIHGLERDDFRLVVDGEPMEIAAFEEVRAGRVELGGSARPSTHGSAETWPAAAPPAPALTRYLVFIDNYMGADGSRRHAVERRHLLDRLRDDLALLPPDDPMALVVWDGRRLEVLAPWTTDRGRIGAALETGASRPAGRAEIERRRAVTREQSRRIVADQLSETYRAVTAALQGFAGGSGRSVALLVAGGWPYDVAGGGPRSLLITDTRDLARRLAEVANASGFTLYPIDAPGAQADPSVTALVGGLDDVPGAGLQPLSVPDDGSTSARLPDDALAMGRIDRSFERSWAEFDAESTLLLLAAETGGVALINGQRTSALRQAVADVSSFYRLGFYHSSRADGGVRDIAVAVDRPGIEVRSRRSFADLTTSARAQVALDQALLLGVATTAEPLAVRLGQARPAGRWKVQVPFEVEIPMGDVTVRQAGRGEIATSLELHVAVEDEEGRRNTVATLPVEIETVAAAVGGHVVWEAAVTLRNKGHEVLFALSDPESGRVFVGRASFDG